MKPTILVAFDFENWLGQFLAAYCLRNLGEKAERERLMFDLFNGIKGMIDSETDIPPLARALFDPIQHFGHGHITLGELRREIERALMERKAPSLDTHDAGASCLVSPQSQHSARVPLDTLPVDQASPRQGARHEPYASNTPTTRLIPPKNAMPSCSSPIHLTTTTTPSNPSSSADPKSRRSILDMGLASPSSVQSELSPEALNARRKRKSMGKKSGVKARLYRRFQKTICVLARDMTQEEFDTLSRSEKALITRIREENASQDHLKVFGEASGRHESPVNATVSSLDHD